MNYVTWYDAIRFANIKPHGPNEMTFLECLESLLRKSQRLEEADQLHREIIDHGRPTTDNFPS